MRGFLLDTNIFNHLVEGKIKKEDLPLEFPTFVTTIQYDEISKCTDDSKRSYLMSWLRTLPDDVVPLETLVWDVGHWDNAKFSDGEMYKKLLSSLESKKKRKNNANIHDALLGETAIIGDMVLVTNDRDLADVVKLHGGFVRSVKQISGGGIKDV